MPWDINRSSGTRHALEVHLPSSSSSLIFSLLLHYRFIGANYSDGFGSHYMWVEDKIVRVGKIRAPPQGQRGSPTSIERILHTGWKRSSKNEGWLPEQEQRGFLPKEWVVIQKRTQCRKDLCDLQSSLFFLSLRQRFTHFFYQIDTNIFRPLAICFLLQSPLRY